MREILKNHVFDGNRYEVLVRNNNEFIGITNGIIKTNLHSSKNLKINFKMRFDGLMVNQVEIMKLNKKQFSYFNNENYDSGVDYLGDDLAAYLYNVKDELDKDIQEKSDLENLDDYPVKDITLVEDIDDEIYFDDIYDPNHISVLNADNKLESFLKDLFSNTTILNDILSKKTESELIQSFNLEDMHDTLDEYEFSIVSTQYYNYASLVTLEINIADLNNFDVIEYIDKNKILELKEDFFDDNNWEIEPYNYGSSISLYKGSEEEKTLEEISM